jgi:hypothetical protein
LKGGDFLDQAKCVENLNATSHVAAIRISKTERLYNKSWAWGGLVAFLALAFAIPWQVRSVGLGFLIIGLAWHWM